MKKIFIFVFITCALIVLQIKQLYAETPENQYQLIHSPNPTFPREAHTQEKSGFIEANISFDQQGNVIDIDIINASNRKVFEKTVLYAVSSWKIVPQGLNKITINRTFDFNFLRQNHALSKDSQVLINNDSSKMPSYRAWLKNHNALRKSYKRYVKRKHGSQNL
jgi:TonB family protein